ncbi:hypothetical protein Q5O14_15680 [Eubacteriaceae bacterium ES2]|nr:hypothetical protein Q5O14_15680 [Eubacteriaceae bacterium ES2]
MKEEIITIQTKELYDLAYPYMSVICGYDRSTAMAQKSQKQAMKLREKIFDDTTIDFLIAPFGKECVKGDAFLFDDQTIPCDFLNNIAPDSIQGGYAFMFHAPMPDLSAYSVSDMYAADSWETCFVDAGRDVLRQLLLKKYSAENRGVHYITDTMAPGLFGMKASSLHSFFKMMDGAKINLALLNSGMMDPLKSFAGIFLILDREQIQSSMDCANCLSDGKNCNYCKNYTVNYMLTN